MTRLLKGVGKLTFVASSVLHPWYRREMERRPSPRERSQRTRVLQRYGSSLIVTSRAANHFASRLFDRVLQYFPYSVNDLECYLFNDFCHLLARNHQLFLVSRVEMHQMGILQLNPTFLSVAVHITWLEMPVCDMFLSSVLSELSDPPLCSPSRGGRGSASRSEGDVEEHGDQRPVAETRLFFTVLPRS